MTHITLQGSLVANASAPFLFTAPIWNSTMASLGNQPCAPSTFLRKILKLNEELYRADRASEMRSDIIPVDIRELKKQNHTRENENRIEQFYLDMEKLDSIAKRSPSLRSEIDSQYMHIDIALARQQRNISYTECTSSSFKSCIQTLSKELREAKEIAKEKASTRRNIDDLRRELRVTRFAAKQAPKIKIEIQTLKEKMKSPMPAKEKGELRKKLQILDQEKDLSDQRASKMPELVSQIKFLSPKIRKEIEAEKKMRKLEKVLEKIKNGENSNYLNRCLGS